MDVQQDYKQMPPNASQVIKDEENQKDNKCCFHFCCWFFQLAVWGLLLASIVLYCIDNSVYIITFPIYGFIHLVYICIELCSAKGEFLINKNSKEGIKETFRKYYQASPSIVFYGRSYHIETVYTTTTNSDGKEEYDETQVEETTSTETYNLPYYSARDVSGLFHLNCKKDNVQKKCYIKLELNEEIDFADTISYSDYENEKNNFNGRNKPKDELYSFTETRSIPGLVKHNLINIGDSDPCIVNHCVFLLSILLTLAEFYKSYVNSLCIKQKYTIRKIISTRYDLSQPIWEEKYNKFNPLLDLISQKYIFEPQDFNYLNDKHQPKLPTSNKIEEAKNYQNKPGIILDIVGVNTNPEKDNEDNNIDKENIKDDNSGINIQMVEKNY